MNHRSRDLYSSSKAWIFTLMGLALLTCTLEGLAHLNEASAKPLPLKISEVSAPHPKHCFDERQWRGAHLFNPYNLFDGSPQTAWQLCGFSIKDPGYTVHFKLETPIEIDGFEITQALKSAQVMSEWGDKKRRRNRRRANRRGAEPQRDQLRTFKRVQVLLFNQALSARYPFYFQEVKFDGDAKVSLEYRDLMAWNSILVGDSGFDERRRGLGLSPSGVTPPVKIDQFSLVFWEYEGSGAPPALINFTLKLKGQRYQLMNLEPQRQAHAIAVSKTYDLFTSDYMFIGDERAMIFSRSGTIWGMEGEEETPKVMGAWRFSEGRIEVDVSPQQKRRTSARQRKAINARRKGSYQPLHMILDDAPRLARIVEGALAGEYELQRAPVPTAEPEAGQDEVPPPFEAP